LSELCKRHEVQAIHVTVQHAETDARLSHLLV